MSRELNLSVFDEAEEKSLHRRAESSMVSRRMEDNGLMGEVVDQIKQLKGALKALEMRSSQSESRISSLFSTALNLSERQQKMGSALESSLKASLETINNKVSQMASKVLHKNADQMKVTELMERHNEVIQKMEARMEKLQRRVAQQEMQLMSYKSVVNELIDRTNR